MSRQVILAAFAAVFLAGSGVTLAASAVGDKKEKPVVVEKIEGTSVKRVSLTEKAAERLGIRTGEIAEEMVVRNLVAGGMVVPPPGAAPLPGLAPTPMTASKDTGGIWVRVTLSEGELGRIARDQPARVVPVVARDDANAAMMAQPSGAEPMTDVKRANLSIHYVVKGGNQDLQPGQRVLIELPLAVSGALIKTVPYGAVIYDDKGGSWIYTSPSPRVFVREKVEVRDIEGNQAALSKGPAKGTAIVTVGAILIYGAEKIGK
jgi:hypothetical protein